MKVTTRQIPCLERTIYTEYPNPTPQVSVATILVNKDEKLLLGKRLSKHAYGVYSCPGGHLEFNEDPIDAAIRETFEETGIKLTRENINFFAYENTLFPNENKHYVVLFFTATVNDDQIPINTEPTKCEGWNWYYWNNLPEPLITGLKQLKNKNLNPIWFSRRRYLGYPNMEIGEK